MIYRTTMQVAAIAVLAMFGLSSAAAANWFGSGPEGPNEAIDVAVLMANPQDRVGQRLTVSGRMTDVCSNKGCWAVLESEGELLRIVARDHGFAIPEDARGPAVAHGVLERQEISSETVEHLVEEDGADAALFEQPVSYRLVADGVRLLP